MVENFHFERLNALMKEARGSSRAFGGVQLIVTGDFCQLPPVNPFRECIVCGRDLIPRMNGTRHWCSEHGVYYDRDKWAFRSKAWKECQFAHVNLTTIHRQSDRVFIDILNKLRMGTRLDEASITLLKHHESDVRDAVKLFSKRGKVKEVNEEKFKSLETEPRPYECWDHFSWNQAHKDLEGKGARVDKHGPMSSLRDHRYEPNVELKGGMLVVLLHNLDITAGLVNGSQGTIRGFEDFDRSKMPKASKKGNDDSALPGVPTLRGDYAKYQEHQLRKFAKKTPFKKWPIVEFMNGVTRTIYADCTVNELGETEPYSLLSRTQIPLMAAWAMTMHKSQVGHIYLSHWRTSAYLHPKTEQSIDIQY